MLRFVFATVSILALGSCDALWASYEVPCDRGFSCPDGGSLSRDDLAMQDRDGSTSGNEDGSTSQDDAGSTGKNDMGPGTSNDMTVTPITDLGPPGSDMLTPLDLMVSDLPIIKDGGVVVLDDGGVLSADLGLAVKGAASGPRKAQSRGQTVVSAGREKR